MNIYEIDWRLSTTDRVLRSLSDGLTNIRRDLDQAEKSPHDSFFDVDSAVDEAESILGIAFVAVQTYLAGAVSDASKIMGTKLDLQQLLKQFSDTLPEGRVTKVQLCYETANYFKHHDEWEDWEETPRNKHTLAVLREAGFKRNDHFICNEAWKLLSPKQYGDLSPLLNIVENWRKAVILYSKLWG